MSSSRPKKPIPPPRRRLSREDRLRQLLEVSWQLISNEGTDALTLGRLAELAGVTKPVVYDHFGTRDGLLVALYRDFDKRQTKALDAALAATPATLPARATVIASAYVDCVLLQGREIPGVLSALAGTPALDQTKRDYQLAFLEKCRDLLTPFVKHGRITQASLWAMLGAADAVSEAAALADITSTEAKTELRHTIIALVDRASSRKG